MSDGSKAHPELRARVRFAVALLAFVSLAWLGFRDRVLGELLLLVRRATADAVALSLNGVGMDAARQATAILHPSGFGIEVSRGCTGLMGFALLLVAIGTYPAERRVRLVGLVICPAAFLGVNLLRLVHLFYLGVHYPTLFHVAHAVIWQGILVGAALALWVWWLGLAKTNTRSGAGAV